MPSSVILFILSLIVIMDTSELHESHFNQVFFVCNGFHAFATTCFKNISDFTVLSNEVWFIAIILVLWSLLRDFSLVGFYGWNKAILVHLDSHVAVR